MSPSPREADSEHGARGGHGAEARRPHLAHPTARKWFVALVPGLLIGVCLGVLLPSLPGLSAPGPIRLTGQILVDDNGDALLIDPTGRTPPQLMVLMPRARTAASMESFEPSTRFVSANALWWDARSRTLQVVGTITGAGAQSTLIDSAISSFDGQGLLERVTLTADIEALSSVSDSPTTNQQLITGMTERANGSRIGLLVGSGRQLVLTKDSYGPASWSVNGQLLAYNCYIDHGSPTLCIYNLRTRRQRVYRLPGLTEVEDPSISPDGTSAVMTAAVASRAAERTTNLAIVNLASGRAQLLTDDDRQRSSPVWSPNGQVIAYATPTSVILRVVATGQEVDLANDVNAESPQWVQAPRSELGTL